MSRACGNPLCGCSTGIHEGLTFGSGDLDLDGYWEKPCYVCARAFDEKQAERRKEVAAGVKSRHPKMTDREIDHYMQINHEYLYIKGWLFKEEDRK